MNNKLQENIAMSFIHLQKKLGKKSWNLKSDSESDPDPLSRNRIRIKMKRIRNSVVRPAETPFYLLNHPTLGYEAKVSN